MTKEEKDRISNQRGMVMPNQLDSGLGMQGVPAFPSNFSNIGPSGQRTGATNFAGGVPATMGIGGINAAYPSSLGMSGRDYAPMRDQSGQTIYRGGPLGLSQPQAFGGGGLERRENTIMDQPFSFTNASGGLANEGYNFRQPSRNTFALPSQTSIPIEGGPLSVGINRAQTAGQMGRIAMQNPFGTIFATEQQQANMNAQRTPDQQSSRTPQQQQELLAQMRTKGAAIGQDILKRNEDVFTAKKAERDTVNEMVSQAMKSGYTEREAKAMVQPYYKAQPSSIAGIQRDFANYQGAGVNKMTEFVQDNIRGMFPSNMGARPAFGSGSSVLPAGGGGGMTYEPIPMPTRIGASDFGTRAGMDTPSPYPSGDESRAKRAARRAQRQGTEYGLSGYNPIIPPELRG
jgi:hypothetical protein